MSSGARALLIGIIGPILQAIGLAWVLLKAVVDPGGVELTVRYLIFDSAHLIIAVGILVSVVCIPVALEVARAEPEDVELERFEAVEEESPSNAPAGIPARSREVAE